MPLNLINLEMTCYWHILVWIIRVEVLWGWEMIMMIVFLFATATRPTTSFWLYLFLVSVLLVGMVGIGKVGR